MSTFYSLDLESKHSSLERILWEKNFPSGSENKRKNAFFVDFFNKQKVRICVGFIYVTEITKLMPKYLLFLFAVAYVPKTNGYAPRGQKGLEENKFDHPRSFLVF